MSLHLAERTSALDRFWPGAEICKDSNGKAIDSSGLAAEINVLVQDFKRVCEIQRRANPHEYYGPVYDFNWLGYLRLMALR